MKWAGCPFKQPARRKTTQPKSFLANLFGACKPKSVNKKKPFPQYNGICRVCGRSFPARRHDFFRAGGFRCAACGGICDPDKPLFRKHTMQRKRD